MMKPISQLRDIIRLACLELALGPKTCHLERAKETSWKRIAALPWGPHSISKAERWHPSEKTHFHDLHLWSYSFSHYSELVTTGESKDIDQSVNRLTFTLVSSPQQTSTAPSLLPRLHQSACQFPNSPLLRTKPRYTWTPPLGGATCPLPRVGTPPSSSCEPWPQT